VTFPISIKIGWRTYKLTIELLYIDAMKEHFKIISKKRNIIVQSNRPLFRNKGLKHRTVTWTIINGKAENNQAYTATLDAIVKYMDAYENKT